MARLWPSLFARLWGHPSSPALVSNTRVQKVSFYLVTHVSFLAVARYAARNMKDTSTNSLHLA